jgi:hypothetical protein
MGQCVGATAVFYAFIRFFYSMQRDLSAIQPALLRPLGFRAKIIMTPHVLVLSFADQSVKSYS